MTLHDSYCICVRCLNEAMAAGWTSPALTDAVLAEYMDAYAKPTQLELPL